jgi:ABC-type multidrug transport system ATPase subunit
MKLTVDGVGKTFGDRRVLTSASLYARPHQVLGLLGRNGAGKTTLLRIAAGMMRPDHGRVLVDDVLMEAPRLARLAVRGLYFMPADESLSRALRIEEQLALVTRRFGTRPDESLLAELRVAELLPARVRELSGGERKRAALALAVARQPRCLLADEPLRDLAPIDADACARVLRRIAETGASVVVTGHEVPTVMTLVDHVTWCTSGTTRELGTPAVAAAEWAFQQEFLGFGR